MTEPKPVVLPLHHDPIAMQKYELFLKLARVSPKKMRKKRIFGCFGAFPSEKSERFRHVFEIFRVIVEWLSSDCQEGVYQRLCDECRRVQLHLDDVSKTFLESFYVSRRLLAGDAPDEKRARTYPLIYIMRKTRRTLAISYFFCNFAPL